MIYYVSDRNLRGEVRKDEATAPFEYLQRRRLFKTPVYQIRNPNKSQAGQTRRNHIRVKLQDIKNREGRLPSKEEQLNLRMTSQQETKTEVDRICSKCIKNLGQLRPIYPAKSGKGTKQRLGQTKVESL